MAKYERNITGNFDELLTLCEKSILDESISSSHEDGSDFALGDVRVAVRVYERYSYIGDNRVSMNLTLVGKGDNLRLSIITSGGSQAVFFKINRFGEDAFLEKLVPIIAKHYPQTS